MWGRAKMKGCAPLGLRMLLGQGVANASKGRAPARVDALGALMVRARPSENVPPVILMWIPRPALMDPTGSDSARVSAVTGAPGVHVNISISNFRSHKH